MEKSKFKDQKPEKNQNSKIKVQRPVAKSSKIKPGVFDLEERMAVFGENIIKLCKILPQNLISKPLILQIVRSATSIGANYAEANNSSSKKDFRNKLYIAKKESQETKHWLRMLKTALPEFSSNFDKLFQENHELSLILQSIANKLNEKNND